MIYMYNVYKVYGNYNYIVILILSIVVAVYTQHFQTDRILENISHHPKQQPHCNGGHKNPKFPIRHDVQGFGVFFIVEVWREVYQWSDKSVQQCRT